MPRVRAINVSAVKSLHLTPVAEATIGRDGIDHDREFMLADATGRIATQRNTRMLAQISSTYDAAADLAKWDRKALECGLGETGICRVM